ncbi:MAG TPA: biotin transporter BioY [Chloroflexota bacterium]|nr:biotin transporter BioY [Chloroflexota bacterium]
MSSVVTARSRLTLLVRQAVACTFFALLVGVCARVAIPLPGGVPFSMQPLAVMLTGLVLGSQLGFVALLEYVAAGALGAPVFALGGGGWAYLAAAPSAGYIYSYPFAVWLIGRIAEAGRARPLRSFYACLAGLVVIYLVGNVYFAIHQRAGLVATLIAGTAPFIAFDVVKAAIAAAVARPGRGLLSGWW